MFVIPCKYNPTDDVENSYVVRCVESIRAHHPDEKILIVDSDSDDLSYFKHLKNTPNLILADAKNRNYLDGAIWYAFNKYPDEEWYCLLQDSITLKHPLDEFIKGEELFYSLMWFAEHIGGEKEMKYLKNVFDGHLNKYKLKHDRIHAPGNSIIGCWGPCFVAKKEMLQRLKENNLDKYLPDDKFGSNVSERIWGMCLKYEGIDIQQNSIDGNFLAIALPRHLFNSKTKYHNKIYGGRQ